MDSYFAGTIYRGACSLDVSMDCSSLFLTVIICSSLIVLFLYLKRLVVQMIPMVFTGLI